jgi:hypothetical protein
VGKGERADVYLEVRKRMGHIFFECNKCLWIDVQDSFAMNITLNIVSLLFLPAMYVKFA